MAVQFTNPQVKYDGVKKLYHCTYTVTGNGTGDEQTKAVGVGDTEEQAKRNAVVTYQKQFPKAFLGIPA